MRGTMMGQGFRSKKQNDGTRISVEKAEFWKRKRPGHPEGVTGPFDSIEATASDDQALAFSSCAFLTTSSWIEPGSFWYLRNSMLKEPLPWVMLRSSFE